MVTHLVQGKYSAIVFDTAPTGHTLKLLQFPEIMQAGLDQLSSWQGKLWGYYSMFKNFMGGGDKKKDSDKYVFLTPTLPIFDRCHDSLLP